jgi:hypothetical protein
MNHILTISPYAGDGTSFYRAAGVIPFLKKEYNDITITDLSHRNDLDWNDYVGYNVVILQRPFNDQHLKTITLLKKLNTKVIIDYDDDLLNLDSHNPYFAGYTRSKDNIEAICSLADEIWVSTESLMKTFSVYNENITIIPNAHNDYLFPIKEKRKFNINTKKVSYRGGKTHELDVYNHFEEWLSIINDNQDFEFSFLGARFPYLETKCGDNYLIVEGLHIMEYFNYFFNLSPNIFIYPLEDTKFNQGKSNISWIEATYAGAVVLAPNNINEFLGKPGMLNFNEKFIDMFNRIKTDYKVLEILNELSWTYIQNNLLLSQVNQLRYNSILDVQKRK